MNNSILPKSNLISSSLLGKVPTIRVASNNIIHCSSIITNWYDEIEIT